MKVGKVKPLLSKTAIPLLLLTAWCGLPLRLCAEEQHAHDDHGSHEEGGGHSEHGHDEDERHGEASEGEHGDAHGHGGGHGHGHDEAPAFTAAALRPFGVDIKEAAPGKVRVSFELSGRLVPHEDRVVHVVPRYPGIIREVRKRIGDRVAPGEVVAVIESNQTLHVYEVKTSLEGTVVRRHANTGEFVDDKSELFELADYSVLFADFYAFPAQQQQIRPGQKLFIRFPGREETAETTISFLAPGTDPETQARLVRGVLDNRRGQYQPGTFITGEVVVEESEVPIAVDATAVRTKGGQTIVFVEEGGRFKPQRVRTGRRDRSAVEIVAGLEAGDRYAAGNTFIVQAELEKGEAEHEH